ncbi:hypothetical protein [Actinokineospora enzanensis]|uniref:hypothetical protein n=1 Tax=Actinokineospora enzanensis TaxID=155975 RepID=UPI001FE0DB06|nr:hypothetical protein [Actinokineospora enzanensis]
MLALMALNRRLSNPELHDLLGFTLVGDDRTGLVAAGLITSKPEGRPYVHELTDRGWAWCGGEMEAGTPPPPRPRSTLVPALYLLLARFGQLMRREKLVLADLVTEDVDIESRIRAAYRELASSPRGWVGLVELRPLLGDAPTDEVDAVLTELSRTGQAHLVPESNRKALTEAARAAAVRIGGEDNHLISLVAS